MEEPKSKSQKKRDADALQKIGVELVELSLEKLATLPLPDNLRKAIVEAKAIKSHGALRRQAQLIGKLMRNSESEEILASYEALRADESATTAIFHDIEIWRTRLMTEGNEALTEFIDTYRPSDVQQLRQLIKKAIEDQAKEQNTGAHRALFRSLRSIVK